VACLAAATPALAQSDVWSLDSAVSINYFAGENAADRPDIIVDLTGTARLGGGWVAYVRPWFRKASSDPYEFAREIYQAAVQHEHAGPIATRLEIGYILSPIGLGMMDMRPDTNPTIMPHLSYLIPMPAFDRGAPSAMPIASSYPLGAQFTASGSRWDGRVAALTSSPNRGFVVGSADGNPSARPIVVTGGGFTPRTGMRLGVGYAAGSYVADDEVLDPSGHARRSQLLSIEGDLAFNYTRITGEVARARLQTAPGHVIATSWFIQGQQTLTPRVFVAARHEGANAPDSVFGLQHPTLRMSEATAGYRLTPAFTLRSSFTTRKTYYSRETSRQVGVSLVWAQRWR
jgi:hypothetical protein